MHQTLFILPAFLLVCCKPAKLDEKIIGTWIMDNVYEYNKDVTEKHNPKQNRWITFYADGSFYK
jgi:hypothetical protein